MTGRNNPVTLTSPTGASVKCAANKRFALAHVVATEHDARLSVLFRTNDQEAAIKRGKREAKNRNTAVAFFTLTDGRFLGHFLPSGVFRQAHQFGEARR